MLRGEQKEEREVSNNPSVIFPGKCHLPLHKGGQIIILSATAKKDRQYSNQGVKCSYHTHIFNGGKNIVLHTFYTI